MAAVALGLLFGLILAMIILFVTLHVIRKNSKQFLSRRYHLSHRKLKLNKTKAAYDDVHSGKYKTQNVIVVPIPTSLDHHELKSRDILKDLDGLVRFSKSRNGKFVEILGFMSEEARDFRLVFINRHESNLSRILQEVKLTLELKFSLVRDLALALNEIHRSSLKCHGDLRSNRCVVDDRFVLRLMLVRLSGLHRLKKKLQLKTTIRRKDTVFDLKASQMVWRAPELLRNEHSEPSSASDVYSLAIIMHEIVFQRGPFNVKAIQGTKHGNVYQQKFAKDTNTRQFRSVYKQPQLDSEFDDESCAEIIINKVMAGPLRPSMPFVNVRPKFLVLEQIIEQCWNEDPLKRPKSIQVVQRLQNYMKSENIDAPFNTSKRLQEYSKKLIDRMLIFQSEAISERDQLLKYLVHMIPSHLSYELMKGGNPAPDQHERVTIYFNDLVEFNSSMKQQNSVQTIEILHEVFQAYDGIVKLYDVVPLNRVGSSLLLAAGVLHNTPLHASEIAQPALQLRQFAKSYKRVPLKLRGGIHSGPVMSGIVGKQIPQFGLFGDTVNTASRMASHGEVGESQISEGTHSLLVQSRGPAFHMKGPQEKLIKGKDKMITYMLVGCGNIGANIQLNRRLDDRPIPKTTVNHGSPSSAEFDKTASADRVVVPLGMSTKRSTDNECDEWKEFLDSNAANEEIKKNLN